MPHVRSVPVNSVSQFELSPNCVFFFVQLASLDIPNHRNGITASFDSSRISTELELEISNSRYLFIPRTYPKDNFS